MLTQWAGTRHATRNSFPIKERLGMWRSWLFATLSIEAFKIVGMWRVRVLNERKAPNVIPA